jgi:hypothetical protein
MHATVLVVGPDPDAQLAPFDTHLMDESDDPDVVEEGNPNGKWDDYELGGRYAGGLYTRGGGRATQCLAGELDLEALAADMVYAVLANGEWLEDGIFDEATQMTKADPAYMGKAMALLAGLPADTQLSLYDYHD